MDEKDIEIIVKDVVTPIVLKAMEELNNVNEKVDNTVIECITELSSRLDSYRIAAAKNLSFIKSVLIYNGLTTQDEYDKYMQEWDRLNASTIRNSYTGSISEDDPDAESTTASIDNND